MPRRDTRRAGKGEGSKPWQDKQGRWYCRITVDGRRHTVAADSADGALNLLEELKARLKQGIRVIDARQTLNAYAEYVHNTRLGGGESTKFDRLKRINACIAPVIGERRLCDLDTPMIADWWNLIKETYAYNSAKQALSLLKRILDLAVIDKLIPYNYAAPIRPMKQRAETTITDVPAWEDDDEDRSGVGKVMTVEQVELFLEVVKDDWLEPLYLLAFLGPRRGELLGFRWLDYDPAGKRVRVAQQVILLEGGKPHISILKTDSSRRFLYLTDEYVLMLNRHRVAWNERRSKAIEKGAWEEHDLLFCTRTGRPMNPRNLLRHFYKVQEKLGFGELVDEKFDPHFRFHDLRHSSNQHMQDAGVSDIVRAAVLGHGINVNKKVYLHASKEAKREAIEKTRKQQNL